MTKHTPGPWKQRGRYIIKQQNPGGRWFDIAETSLELGSQSCIDNARLIAAAPELLEVCKAALADESTAHRVAELCRAAIEKAEAQ